MKRRRFLQTLLGAGTAAAAGASPSWAASAARRVLYVFNVFSARDPVAIEAAVRALAASQFNALIFAFVYARYRQGALRLSYNGLPLAAAHPQLAASLRRLRGKRLMVSLGGWGNRGTFEAIRDAGVPAFLRQLERELLLPYGIEGIDLDLEPGTVRENTAAGWHAVHDDLGATLVELTLAYQRAHPAHAVTHAPISSVARDLYVRDGGVQGVRGSLLEATRIPGGNALAWLNVQFYEAGAPPGTVIADYYSDELVAPLLGAAARTGIARPGDFFLPGFEPRFHETRAVCQATLAAIDQRLAGLAGAPRLGGFFVWEYRQIAGDIPGWSGLAV